MLLSNLRGINKWFLREVLKARMLCELYKIYQIASNQKRYESAILE